MKGVVVGVRDGERKREGVGEREKEKVRRRQSRVERWRAPVESGK
jgi:hypothetical protein